MIRVSFVTLVTIVLYFPTICSGQSFKDILVDPSDNGKILAEFLEQLEDDYPIDFIYDPGEMRALTLTGITERKRFNDYLHDYLANYRVFRYDEKVIFILDRKGQEEFSLAKENFILFSESDTPAVILRGTVSDAISKDPLIGAKISIPKLKALAVSDVDGRFEVNAAQRDIIEVNVEYVGYEQNRYIIGFSRLGTGKEMNVALYPESKQLQSVTITAERADENITEKITGVENLSIGEIKSLPTFLGEVDPIRSLTTLPGVSTVGELSSGFHVRGGESGQNLVLQDGAIIYNPSHLFGFFSAFNPDLISNVTLYKGGGPAHFGSRISSVLDVSLRNGDAGKHTVSGGVGLISSRLSLEGPIVKNKSTYLIGGRFSYANWLVNATDNISLKNSAANFLDFTGKIFHTINENNYVTLSAYKSYDDFKLATDSVFSWSTANFSLKWDHTFNEHTSAVLTLVNSNYASDVRSISEIEGYLYENAIRNGGLKYDVTHAYEEDSKIIAGVELNGTWLEPGKLTPDNQFDNVAAENMQNQRSLESAVYFQWDTDLTGNWLLSAGLRYGYFLRFGPENIYSFNYSEIIGRYPAVEDTIGYNRGDVIKRYSGVEPRVSVTYLVDEASSFKAGYYRGYQYMHLISNTSSTTPQDYWVTSGPYLRPQIGDQYSLGFFRNLKEHRYEISVEGFYKDIHNAVDYVEGADITLNPVLEAGLSQGQGLAYGLEVLMKKSNGRMNGWLAYTYSRSVRKFADEDQIITINEGKYYPSAFDQPHHLSLIMNYQLTSRSSFSANFNYSSGRPITIPVSKFSYDAYLAVLNYSERNDYRIPDYHRLDVSLTIRDKPRNNKRLNGEWVISLFNVYGRKNTYSISFDRYGKASKMSVLGSVFPSVTYNFRF